MLDANWTNSSQTWLVPNTLFPNLNQEGVMTSPPLLQTYYCELLPLQLFIVTHRYLTLQIWHSMLTWSAWLANMIIASCRHKSLYVYHSPMIIINTDISMQPESIAVRKVQVCDPSSLFPQTIYIFHIAHLTWKSPVISILSWSGEEWWLQSIWG